MGLLDGKAVIITGAGTGLGRAYAVSAAAEGARVVVNDVTADRLAEVAAEITAHGGEVVACAGSVADWNVAAELVETCRTTFGSVDGLVNNAGVIRIEEPWKAEEAGIRAMVEVNLMGAAFVGAHALRVMVEQGSGAIVNATSSAQMGLSQMSVYGATKGALASLTYGWALDTQALGIRVNAYAPVAWTAMVAGSSVAPAQLPTTEDNAPVVLFLLSDLAGDITGQVIQRRGDGLSVMAHPDLTDHVATPDAWTTEAVARALGPVLREGAQPIGDPRMRAAR
jgi:NAD(P)-dependent dehydrogenase (short-subunit alcohol dehydrogenase family)